MTSRPTQVMDTVTTTAMAAENRASCQKTRTPRLSARAGWTAESIRWLKDRPHRARTSSRITISRIANIFFRICRIPDSCFRS